MYVNITFSTLSELNKCKRIKKKTSVTNIFLMFIFFVSYHNAVNLFNFITHTQIDDFFFSFLFSYSIVKINLYSYLRMEHNNNIVFLFED